MLLLLAFVFGPAETLPAASGEGASVVPAGRDHGFTFVRIRYESTGRGWRGRDTWRHDYPTAELNFYEALERTTRVHVEGPPLVLELNDDRIFEHPVLYLCEPGWWQATEDEAKRLGEYLNRGGFILFDDFRGEREWRSFIAQMDRVLPDRAPVEIMPDHPVWDIYYSVDPVEAPSNVSGGYGKYEDRYLGFFDDEGRMMALICYNQDIGDGWEWPDRNLEDASTISFQMGVNFLIYALTH